jgi:hypothetical protein
LVQPSGRFHDVSFTGSVQSPQTGFTNQFADVRDAAGNGLIAEDLRGNFGRRGQQELEILAVAERVIQCSDVSIRRTLLFGKLECGR